MEEVCRSVLAHAERTLDDTSREHVTAVAETALLAAVGCFGERHRRSAVLTLANVCDAMRFVTKDRTWKALGRRTRRTCRAHWWYRKWHRW